MNIKNFTKINFRKILTYWLFFACLTISSSCTSKMQNMLPAMANNKLSDELDSTSEEYRAGWKDGCETGISGGANTFYKMFYRNNKVDGYRLSNSPDYRDAWDYGFWYCFRSTYIRQKSSIWGSIMKGYR